MNNSTRMHLCHTTTAASWLLVAAMSCFMANPSRAADASADKPEAAPVVLFVVNQSTAVDRLVQKFYPNSPIATSALRKALQDANPKIITGNPQQRVKAGTSLVVPDHAQVASTLLAAIAPPPTAKSLDSGPSASDNAVRKPWVRFP
jgi:phage tail protein X